MLDLQWSTMALHTRFISYPQKMAQLEEEKQWYVLQAMHGKAEKAKEVFSNLSIESFVPMKVVPDTAKHKKGATKLIPVLSHLIFADTTLDRIKEIRRVHNYIYYKTDITQNGSPMIVPRSEMEHFIDFVQSGGEEGYSKIEYIDNDSFNISKGEKVRILSGAFKGQEGIFVKVSGKHRKQIVVSIAGVLSIEIIHPNPSQIIEKI